MMRFDKFNAERMAPIASSETPQLPPPSKSPMPKLSGSVTPGKNGVVTNGSSKQSEYSSASPKRSSDGYSTGSPPAKKRVKQSSDGADADAMLAARLQAEENNLRRPTRGGGTRKRAAPLKKSPKKKAKSSTKIKSGDDSAVSSEDTEDKPSKRGGAFNVRLRLLFNHRTRLTTASESLGPVRTDGSAHRHHKCMFLLESASQ